MSSPSMILEGMAFVANTAMEATKFRMMGYNWEEATHSMTKK